MFLQNAEAIRDYWNERNKERIANISKLPLKPEYATAWQKLRLRLQMLIGLLNENIERNVLIAFLIFAKMFSSSSTQVQYVPNEHPSQIPSNFSPFLLG